MKTNHTEKCKICGNIKDNSYHFVSEMMRQMGEEFLYLHCSNCGCLCLLEVPKNMSKYYPDNYYSYTQNTLADNSKVKSQIRKSLMKGKLGCGTSFDSVVSKLKKAPYSWIKKNLTNLESKILDVGCGNGFLIKDMQNFGFVNLIGIDPYLKEPMNNNGIKLEKTDICSLEDHGFQLIMYHHSFEHIADPIKELESIYDKLNHDGVLLLRIPVSDSYAFRKYGRYWVQFDAPRHYYLHTVKSISEMASSCGFVVEDIVYDSTAFQFTGSECYLRNLPMGSYQDIFTKKELHGLEKKAKELNLLRDGDSACFYLRKA